MEGSCSDDKEDKNTSLAPEIPELNLDSEVGTTTAAPIDAVHTTDGGSEDLGDANAKIITDAVTVTANAVHAVDCSIEEPIEASVLNAKEVMVATSTPGELHVILLLT